MRRLGCCADLGKPGLLHGLLLPVLCQLQGSLPMLQRLPPKARTSGSHVNLVTLSAGSSALRVRLTLSANKRAVSMQISGKGRQGACPLLLLCHEGLQLLHALLLDGLVLLLQHRILCLRPGECTTFNCSFKAFLFRNRDALASWPVNASMQLSEYPRLQGCT